MYTVPVFKDDLRKVVLPQRRMVTKEGENKWAVRPDGEKDLYLNPGNYADTSGEAVSKAVAQAWEAHHKRTKDLFEWIKKMECSQVPF